MPSKRPISNPKTTSTEPPPPSQQPIDIDDAAIDETAVVEVDENLQDLSNPDGDATEREQGQLPGAWRERDANRRANGPDDLKD